MPITRMLDTLMPRRAERRRAKRRAERRDRAFGQRVMRTPPIRQEPATGTYTIALYGDILLTTFPDGRDCDAEIGKFERAAGIRVDRTGIAYHSGLLLTDDQPADLDQVVFYAGCHAGFLFDAEAHSYTYAVLPLT